jgi:hypothetical protein
MRHVAVLLLPALLANLAASAARPAGDEKAQAAAPNPSITVGPPETVLANKELARMGRWIDTGITAVNDDGTWKWFSGTNMWGYHCGIGPKERPYARLLVLHGFMPDAPDAARYGFSDPRTGAPQRLEDFPRGLPGGERITGIRLRPDSGLRGYWLCNVYRVPDTGHILGFFHVETRSPAEREPREKTCACFHFSLAISKDGGRTFSYCGRIIEPQISHERWLTEYAPQSKSFNMGFPNYIVKDGFFQAYYTDYAPKPAGTAVARAKVADVIRAAEAGKAAPWHKYYEGRWEESGLGGQFTKLNLPSSGVLHGDAAYNAAIDGYMMVTHGSRKNRTIGQLRIAFSKDGLTWSPWQVIHEDGHYHVYPSIISMGDDNEVTGKSFWVYYRYAANVPMPERRPFRWGRVKVTLENETL